MQLFKYIDRINLINRLIKQKRTGSPEDLANRIGISVSRLARVIEYMKSKGAPIYYDRQLYTYVYQYEYSLQIQVEIESIKESDMKTIFAGQKMLEKNISNAFFEHWSKIT